MDARISRIASSYLREVIALAEQKSSGKYWADQIRRRHGIQVDPKNDYLILRQIAMSLGQFPKPLLKACGINKIDLRDDMGESKPYYPNHGYFIDRSVTLNSDIFRNPDDFRDDNGYYMTRPNQTIFHEFGHGFDEFNGYPSMQSKWLKLSDWSKEPGNGLKRLLIKDKGTPDVLGEWYYNPDAGFTRYYGKRNPWDDYADCFCFYVGGLRKKVPSAKAEYFDNELAKYYA